MIIQIPLTVGALINILKEYHESDSILTSDGNLLYRVAVDKRQTVVGTAVIIERGDRVTL
jgi:hypothetical protein